MNTTSTITFATAQGQRPYQEDRIVVWEVDAGATLLAILDGHGGHEVAEYCREWLPHLWETMGGETVAKRIERVFAALDVSTKHFYSGSTLSLVYLPMDEKIAHVAILGDSPVLIKTASGLNISPEHNVRTNLPEREAAEARGGRYSNGYIWAGSDGLQMSRALGDKLIRKVLSQTPEIYSVPLAGVEFILLASDGLFYPSHAEFHQATERVVAQIKAGAVADDLVDGAVKAQTGDNASAILVRF